MRGASARPTRSKRGNRKQHWRVQQTLQLDEKKEAGWEDLFNKGTIWREGQGGSRVEPLIAVSLLIFMEGGLDGTETRPQIKKDRASAEEGNLNP